MSRHVPVKRKVPSSLMRKVRAPKAERRTEVRTMHVIDDHSSPRDVALAKSEIAAIEAEARASSAPPVGSPIRHRGDLQRAVKDIRAATTLDEAVELTRLLLAPASGPSDERSEP